MSESGLVKLPVGLLLWGEDEKADNGEAGEEAADLAPGCTWSSLESVARQSLPINGAQCRGLSGDWVVGEPAVRLGLWWLTAVA